MSTEIGTVNINLRMSLAKFSADVQQGAASGKKEIKQMGDAFQGSTDDARGSLALLGEEIGVHIPRHLRSAIIAIPGVGQALDAAFSSVAVIAMIGLVVELVKKLKSYYDSLGKLSEAEQKLFEDATKGAKDKMAHLNEMLKGTYALLIAQASGLDKDRLRVELAQALVGYNADYVAGLQKERDHLAANLKIQQDIADAQAKKALQSAAPSGEGIDLFAVFKAVKAEKSAEGITKAIVEAKLAFESADAALKTAKASAIDTGDALKDHVAADAAKAAAEVKKLAAQLATLTGESNTILRSSLTQYDQESLRISDLITKWDAYQTAWKAAHAGIGQIAAAEQVKLLQQEAARLTADSEQAIDMVRRTAEAAAKAAADVKSVATYAPKPVYTGTKEAADLAKLQADENAAVAAGQAIFTATRTAAEQYAQTIAELNVLLKQGKIDQDTYDRAKLEAQTRANTTGAAFKALGQSIGQTINQAALFGASWSDALKSIGMQIAEMIIKLTLMKALTKESAGGGAGGFFASIISGLASSGAPGKAMGGPVEAGRFYTVGERGKELFIPRVSGTIIPSGGIKGGDSSTIFNQAVTMHVSTPDASSFGKSQSHILHQARQHLAGRGGRI